MIGINETKALKRYAIIGHEPVTAIMGIISSEITKGNVLSTIFTEDNIIFLIFKRMKRDESKEVTNWYKISKNEYLYDGSELKLKHLEQIGVSDFSEIMINVVGNKLLVEVIK